MVLVKLNKRLYVTRMNGRGMQRYSRVITQRGTGIVDSLGKSATKYVLGGIGKSSGAFAGKQLGKLIQEKTGSELLGKIAKSGLSALGSVAGKNIGKLSGKLLSDTVFQEPKKVKEKPKVSLNELLEQARSKVMPQIGDGINLIY